MHLMSYRAKSWTSNRQACAKSFDARSEKTATRDDSWNQGESNGLDVKTNVGLLNQTSS